MIELNLDSTALGSSGCIRDLVYTLVGDPSQPTVGAYREHAMNIELVYGIAVHGFVDRMYKTSGNYHTALKYAKELFNSIPWTGKKGKEWMEDEKHLATTCYMLWSEYVETDGTFDVLQIKQTCWKCEGTGKIVDKEIIDTVCPQCHGSCLWDGPATEVTFKIPYYQDDNILVNLCGTTDTVGKFRNGCFAIRDWKTTGAWDNQGYFEKYELSRQLRFYRLACQLMAEKHPDSVLGQVGASPMGAFIDAVFLKPNANETVCKRSIVYQFSPQAMIEFRALVDEKIQELSRAFRDKQFPKQGILTGRCVVKDEYGYKCKFWDVCKSNDNVAQVLLNRDFIRKHYDPLHFNT